MLQNFLLFSFEEIRKLSIKMALISQTRDAFEKHISISACNADDGQRIKTRTAAEESSHSHIHFNEVNYLLPNCPKGPLDITMCPGKKEGFT